MSSQIEAAMANARVAADARGLMPLEEARALVKAAREFRKGAGEMVDGTFVLDSDRLWAALLSLEDTDEFMREARRLRWFFHPRGREDTALLNRYGEAILPWLLGFIKDDGRLIDIPWCVVPCLLRIGKREVFDALWKVRTVVDGVGSEWPGPFAADNPGDADKREGVNLSGPVPDEPDDSADGVVIDWLSAHPVVGYGALAEKALEGDERALFMLRMFAMLSPGEVFGHVCRALGEESANRAFDQLDFPKSLEPRCVLQGIRNFMRSGRWPLFIGEDVPAYHALRMLVARERDSETWGIVFERLEGAEREEFRVHRFMYSPSGGSGEGELEPPFDVDDSNGATARARGPAGEIAVTPTLIEERDLHPDWVTAEGVASSRFSVLVRAYLSEHPGAFWSSADDASALLSFDGEAQILADCDAYEHIIGTHENDEPDDYDARWCVAPDDSTAMQSLARAVASRDPSLFDPSTPDTDWRLHALFRPEHE